MKRNDNLRTVPAALLVLAVFAVGMLGTLLGGAGIYRRLVSRDKESFDRRTALQYITTRVRQASGPVEIASFGDGDALLLRQRADGETYLTRVYCFDGWLMELFSAENGDFSPEDGEKLLPLEDLTIELAEGLLRVRFTDSSGMGQQLYLQLPEVMP